VQVVFPALLPLAYIPTLLSRIKQLFLSLFQPYLQTLIETLTAGSIVITDASRTALKILKSKIEEERWDKIFERCLRGCEEKDSVGDHSMDY
jgi:signal recognition particle receptor subunit alpha